MHRVPPPPVVHATAALRTTVVNTLLLLSPTAMVCRWSWLPFCSLFLALCAVSAYEVPITDVDWDRQVCSGMWGGRDTYINGVPGH